MQVVKEHNGFVYTTAIEKLRKMSKRIRVIPGGTSAGKTFGILPILIDTAIRNSRFEISVVSESIPHLRRGALKDFEKIMRATGRWVEDRFNRTLLKYNFSNGSYIEFFSADQSDKLRGARRNILYINECNNVTFDAYLQLSIRTSHQIWLDFNPSNQFWAHEELQHDEDAEWLTLTYKDNEALSESIVKEIEKARDKAVTSSYWANWWKVYGLGELGTLEGVIFNNWKIIDNVPPEARYKSTGVDFGFTNDPTTAIDKYEWNGLPIYDEVLYQKGMLNSDIARVLKEGNKRFVIADSAEPKSIKELQNYGLTIKGAEKGKDSINFGIQTIQSYEVFYVTARSVNLIAELRKYAWDKDKTGKTLNVPIDMYNHCFTGDTLISTSKGLVAISKINIGDLVLTSNGYRRVLKKWDNGIKQVNKYSMQCGTLSLNLCSTENHKIKTERGWKAISELTKGESIYLHKPSMELISSYMKGSVTIQKDANECMLLCGNMKISVKCQKVIMCITKTVTRITTILRTSKSLIQPRILKTTERNGLRIIRNGLRDSIRLASKRLRIGISQNRELNGTDNTLDKTISENLTTGQMNALIAGVPIRKGVGIITSVQTTANHPTEENQVSIMSNLYATDVGLGKSETDTLLQSVVSINVVESWKERVYDLMVEDVHEYFANGVLVHNCIDSIRYLESNEILKPKIKTRWRN